MNIDLDMIEERDLRVATMSAEFRAAQQRRLVKKGIALWNRSEAAMRPASVAVAVAVPPPRKN